MKRPEKTQAQLRCANRGNVPGVLGMAELAMLAPPKTPGLSAGRNKSPSETTSEGPPDQTKGSNR